MKSLKLFFFLSVVAACAVTTFAQTPNKVYFSDDFENGTSKWRLSSGTWGLITTDFRSGSNSFSASPGQNYAQNANSILAIPTTKPIDLTGATHPILSFWHKYSISSTSQCCYWTDYDYGYVEVSTNYGVAWTQIASFTGKITSWTPQELDLTPYVGEKVLIRFRLWDNGDGTESWGWLLDDVEVREKGPLTVGVTVSVSPSGSGTVTGKGINCPGTCAETFPTNWNLSGQDWALINSDYESASASISASPNGNYALDANSTLELSKPVDISKATAPALTYWDKYSIASTSQCCYWTDYDYGYVEISQDDGLTWTQINKETGTVSSWTQETVDLTPYITGGPILIRFRLADNGDGTEDWGWKVDDIQIVDLPTNTVYFSDDFSSATSVPDFSNMTLTATPSAGYALPAWTGCNSTDENQCIINRYIDRAVSATFATAPAPTISFTVPNQAYGAAPFTVAATSNSAGAFTYKVVSGPAKIAGATVTLTGAGTVVLQASQAASSSYAAGTKQASFTVNNPVPAITTLSPTSAPAGGAAFTLTVNGSNFVKASVVNWNGSPRTTTYVSATKLTAAITAADVATAGTYPVTVTNPVPGGGTSAAVSFSVPILVPAVTTLSPASATMGGAAFTLTVNGSNFVPTSVVNWNGSARTTTYVSATKLTAAITATDIAAPSVGVPVTVTSPAPGGGTSNAAGFPVGLPVPTLASVSPVSAIAGGKAFTLTVTGSNFVKTSLGSSVVNWNGSARTTTFVSATQLTAAITAADIATPSAASGVPVTVTNPAPGGGTSGPASVVVGNPVPVLTALNPPSRTIGQTVTLYVYGSEFVNSSVINWNNAPLATTYVSASRLTAVVPANDITSAGTYSITVTNPAPGGGTSAPLTFTMNNPAPKVSAITPASAIAGGAGLNVTIQGTGFINGSQVNWNGSPRTTTYVSATQLTVAVTAADIASAGTASVTVTNLTPGGGTSGPVTFTIKNPVPVATSLQPTSAIASGAGFNLTVNGTNFVSNSVVNWNGSPRTTKYVSATQLTAAIPAADIAAAGTAAVTVVNPTPGGGTSKSLAFKIIAPVLLSSISPTSAIVSGPPFTLTANGSGFLSGCVVQWNGTALATTIVSATKVTATVPAGDIAATGTFPVTVYCTGLPVTAAKTFAVNNPAPVLISLSPSGVIAGGSSFTLTATGSGFLSSSVLQWNGTPLSTTYVSANSLQTTIPASDLLEGSISITVSNPTPGGGVSKAQTLTIYTPVPVVMSLSPSSAKHGGSAFTLTVNGFNFNQGATVMWNKVALATTYVSDMQLQATVPASAITTVGAATITVVNPAPSISASNPATFTIN